MSCSKCFNELFKPWVSIPNGLLLAAIGVVLAMIWPEQGAAAWVQAIGSVAAILISVWVARSADRRADQERRERDRVQLQVIVSLVKAVEADIGGLQSSIAVLAERREWGQAHTVISSTTDMLNALDLVQFGNADDVRAFFLIRNTTRRALHFVHILLREPSNGGAVQSLEGECNKIMISAQELIASINSRAP